MEQRATSPRPSPPEAEREKEALVGLCYYAGYHCGLASVVVRAGIELKGEWVIKDDTVSKWNILQFARTNNAYVVVGYIPAQMGKMYAAGMEILVKGDPTMRRPFIVMEANPKKVPEANSAGAVSQFNTTYGAGKWQITGLTLSLASNFGGQGEQPNNGIFNSINAGNFGITWLAYDNWVEGSGGGMGSPGFPNNSSVSFNSIPTLFSAGSDSLGTYAYAPPGDNIYANYTLPLDANLVADAAAGGDVSLYFYAADNQVSYLFNARSFASNRPEFTLSAAPTPEPATWVMMTLALGGFVAVRRRKMKV